MRAMLGCAVALVLCFGASAEDKKDAIDAKKLVGKWEPKEKGAAGVVEFTKDGKVTITANVDGKESKFEGTYKIDGNKLSATVKAGDKEQTQTRTITKLTDTELVTTDDKGKERQYARIKGK
jgi:uncharacterized protein (TIGR03066 family)